MATARQRKLAQAIVKNSQLAKPLNKKELLVSSGYSVISAEASAGLIIEQKGVQEELSTLGFTEANAKAVTASILLGEKSEDRDKLKAADMVFKVHGTYVPEQSKEAPSVVNIFHNPNVLLATQMYEASLKALITNGATQPIPPQDNSASTDNA